MIPPLRRRLRHGRGGPAPALVVISLLLAACAGSPAVAGPSAAVPATPSPTAGTVTLYSTVTASTVEAVVAAFQAAHPEVTVDLFRGPTGEVAARVAAEQRSGGVRADLLWLTDSLSLQRYDADGLLAPYDPAGAAALDPADRSATYTGTRLLNMVLVVGADVADAPTDWADLTDPSLASAVAIPDPGFAGSAFGLLGHFAQDPDYGLDFYQRLHDNGAVVVQAPDEVTSGVAEGRFKAGITLDFSARSAVDKGSPVRLVWPTSGAITIASPIAQVEGAANAAAAQAFIDFVLSTEGQTLIAASGWQPVRPDVGGGPPIEGPQVRPDVAAAFGRQDELLASFRAIFEE